MFTGQANYHAILTEIPYGAPNATAWTAQIFRGVDRIHRGTEPATEEETMAFVSDFVAIDAEYDPLKGGTREVDNPRPTFTTERRPITTDICAAIAESVKQLIADAAQAA